MYGTQAPVAPTGLTATPGNAQVSLSWTAAGGATSYNVKSAAVDGGPYSTVTNVTGTSYLNTGLRNGTSYYYVITAMNAGGESGPSSQVGAIRSQPATTHGLPPINRSLVRTAQPTLTRTMTECQTALNF